MLRLPILGRSVCVPGTSVGRIMQCLSTISAHEDGYQQACFGAGCFWGTEKFFKSDFPKKYPQAQLLHGAVGYMGPSHAIANPTYQQVCTGQTGHVEVYDVCYNGGDNIYESLCRHFFSFHDPTQENRQGNDIGTQYASVIFYYDDRQAAIAEKVRNDFQQLLDKRLIRYSGGKILTDIKKATVFYRAEDYHQEYLDNNPGGYCNHFYRIDTERI